MNERLAHGRAVISGHLGGARLAPEMDSLVAILAEDNGRPPRAKPEAWPNGLAEALAAVDSAFERNATQAATINNLEGLKRTAQGEAERAKRYEREALAKLEVASRTARLATLEAAELREVLEPLAAILAAFPLGVLAEYGAWPQAAELHLKAKALREESQAERYERLEEKESGNAS